MRPDDWVPDALLADILGSLSYMPMKIADPANDLMDLLCPWIEDCVKNHKTCSSANVSKRLPRRLIDVSLDDLEAEPHLYETKENETGHYVALSHCWGVGQHFITERSSLQERIEGMRWIALPKTFQDAIIVTRKLHIKYLWIDSLCIVQDDELDWDEQVMQMGPIYENSYLTIAAVSAGNDQAGFLSTRAVGKALNLDASFPDSTGLCVREVHERIEGPLETRAWGFQERILPPRTLSFFEGEMSWECNKTSWTESGQPIKKLRSTEKTKFYRLTSDKTNDPTGSLVYSWWYQNVVLTYSRLKLTKESDRLPALSAVAEKIRMKFHGHYLAGIWRERLLDGLLWRTEDRRSPAPGHFTAKYRAPTWSWASIETQNLTYLRRGKGKCTYEATVLDAQCEEAGSGPTGAVQSGFIKLKCRSISTTMRVTKVGDDSEEDDKTYKFSVFPEKSNSTFPIFLPDLPLTKGQAWTETGGGDGGGLTGLRSRLKPKERRAAFTASVTCICVIREVFEPVSLTSRSRVEHYFLVLGHSSRIHGAYERLGLLELALYDEMPLHHWEEENLDTTEKEFLIV